MKALTLTQPWATLVAIGAKRIETRSWNTNYRGQLAIHAAKGGYNDDLFLMKIEPFYSALVKAGITSRLGIPLGGVLATCTLVNVENIKDGYWKYITSDERAFGDYTPGRYAWRLEDVEMLPSPIAAKGALGLWNWEN
jgi:hypothetical protein